MLNPFPHFQCRQFPELLRVTLQLDTKSLIFSEVIADFRSCLGRNGALERDQKGFLFHRVWVNASYPFLRSAHVRPPQHLPIPWLGGVVVFLAEFISDADALEDSRKSISSIEFALR